MPRKGLRALFLMAKTALRRQSGGPSERSSCVTKAELVDHVAERVQLPKYKTEAVVTSVLQCIMDTLRAGDTVELRGFGSFRLRRRPPRVGRNPKTGDKVQIPATQVPWFTAGKALRALVNQPER